MTRARSSLRSLRDAFDIYVCGESFGVNLRCFGGEDVVDVVLRKQCSIGGKIAWVAIEVVFVVELGGVDEDGNNNDVGGLTCLADEREVSLVQRAHGRDECYGLALASQLTSDREHALLAVDDLHLGLERHGFGHFSELFQ